MIFPTSVYNDFIPNSGAEEEAARLLEEKGYDAEYVAEKDKNVDLNSDNPVIDELRGFSDNERALWIDSSRELYSLFVRPQERRKTGNPRADMAQDRFYKEDDFGGDLTMPPQLNDDEIGQWGLELMGRYNYRPETQLSFFDEVENMTERQQAAFFSLLQGYDKLPDGTWSGTKRMLGNLATSPSTYLSLGTLGTGFLARLAFKSAGKAGVMNYIRSLIPTAIATGVESGGYASLDDAMRQQAAIAAEQQKEFDLGRNLVATGVGTVAGAGLAMGLPAAVQGGVALARGANNALGAAVDRMGGGQVLSSGVGPVDIPMAPEGARAHKVPHQLLSVGTGAQPQFKVTQAFSAANKPANFLAIDEAKAAHPQALTSIENWNAFQQDTFGGDLLPVPPMQAINYAQSSEAMADKLQQLSPEMKAGVDEGFANVSILRDMYSSGEADAETTANLFVWGILSRGAGPVQQESAYIDIIADAGDLIQKAVDGTFDDVDLAQWQNMMREKLPEGSPGKQVTMNVNAAGKLLQELAKKPDGSDQTVLQTLHAMMGDTNMSAGQIRRTFMDLTDGAGIDNKVVSFILLVGGRDDVLVMDRIQSRHLWDDGRFEGANIYDGFGKEGTTVKEGLQGVMRGPRGLLLTEALEDGLRGNVAEAYRMIGREQDASLGRFHWESWVIDGEQVVDHETLKAVASKNPVGVGVREGKPGTFSSGMRYKRGESGQVVEYPLSDGSDVYMSPPRMKEFEKYVKNPKNGIIPKGFKVTERKDVRWFERPEVDREKLDAAAREFANADAQGKVVSSTAQP